MRRQSNYVALRYRWLCAALSGRLGYGLDREGIKPAPAEARSSHHEHGGLVVHPVWRAEQGVVALRGTRPSAWRAVNRVTSSDLSCSCEVSRQTASKTPKRLDKGGLLVWKGKNKADPFQYYELPDSCKEL